MVSTWYWFHQDPIGMLLNLYWVTSYYGVKITKPLHISNLIPLGNLQYQSNIGYFAIHCTIMYDWVRLGLNAIIWNIFQDVLTNSMMTRDTFWLTKWISFCLSWSTCKITNSDLCCPIPLHMCICSRKVALFLFVCFWSVFFSVMFHPPLSPTLEPYLPQHLTCSHGLHHSHY